MSVRNLSIRAKVSLVAIAVSTTVLTLAILLFLAYDLLGYHEQLRSDLAAQARILGTHSRVAVASGDRAGANQMLLVLRTKPEVREAVIYDAVDGEFARFTAAADSEVLAEGLPSWASGSIEVDHEMQWQGQRVGRLLVRSDLRLWHARAVRSLGASAGLLVVAALLGFLLSDRLHGVVTSPIARLKESMQAVSAHRDYAVRVEKTSEDDVGQLIGCFNDMLHEIQQRDEALQQANLQLEARSRALEQEIVERTRAEQDLKALAATLEQRVMERSAALEQRARALAASEDQLRQQSETLQSVLDSMGDGVIVADESGEMSLFNEAAAYILGLDTAAPETLDWRTGHAFLLPDMSTPCPADALPMWRGIRGEAVDGTELYVPATAQRDARWLSANARPLRQHRCGPGRAVVVFRDVTEQKRVQDALVRARDAAEAASRAKSAFLANMSHELRTPLNAIIGYSELLEETAADNGHDDYRSDLQKVQSAGKHLLVLINDVLDLSKIEAGRMEVALDEFDVAPAIEDLAGTILPLAEKNHNVLHLCVHDGVGTMRSDLMKVRQVLFNLLSNACKFTDHGTITLDARRHALDGRDWIAFRVSDSGIGIAAEQAQRLFQDFTQADASTTRRYGGTGLGLAISRRFCQMLGGSIDLASTPGQGTTFTVRLPADAAPAAAAASEAVAPGPVADGGEVLVIDDDPAARQLIARHLQREGFRAVLASSGSEGLAIARDRPPLAITLDVLMPDMDGWAVLQQLKSDPTLAHVPVIMLTLLDDQQMGYALGAAAYVQKPIDATQLASALHHVGLTPEKGGHVLVVDDDEATRTVLRRQLEGDHWKVSAVQDGREALRAVCTGRPDVILLDLMMPEMDGFQFLEALRKEDAVRQVPVIVISGKDVSPEERARLNGNVVRIMQKRNQSCDSLLPEVSRLVRSAARAREAA
jgi:PAS domain S-box-containing protein